MTPGVYAGQPEPEVTWSKDGELVRATANDTRISIEMDVAEHLVTLEICNAKMSDSGRYTVAASNSEGTVTQVIEVSVLTPVDEDLIPEDQ